MSKKKSTTKGKTAARTAPKKTAARTSAAPARTAGKPAGGGSTSQITIFLFRTATGNKIRTSPQHAYAGGFVEWTVVNLIDGTDVPVRITWPNGSPFGEQELAVRSWNRVSARGVKPGVYKYVVHALDAQEDPEVEFPEGN
jgi:hypothetical protein